LKNYAVSDIGMVRHQNEDYLYASDRPVGNLPNLFVVADGMGGHKGGEYASSFVVDRIVQLIRESAQKPPMAAIRESIEAVNRELFRKAESTPELFGMGTTLVLGTIIDETLYVANVGDSRLYVLQDGQLHQITRDHSLVEEMALEGKLDRNSEFYKLKKNIITRCIGVDKRVNPDLFEVELGRKDRILLCTDGLTNMVEDARIAEILKSSKNLSAVAHRLIDEGRENGGRDNLSVIVIDPDR